MTIPASPAWADRYRLMTRMRLFEETCLEGVSTREVHGELHTAIGQEAVAAAMAEHLRADDAVVSTHRNHLHGIAKDVPLHPMLAEIFEKSTGLCGGFGGHMHLFDPERRFSTTGIVGAGMPVALGHAYAAQLQGRDSVAFACMGDGAVNTGGFHESMNMAAVMNLPVVVLIENNEWAISVPFSASSATETLAERSVAYDAPGERVDGLDVEATSAAIGRAVAHVRAGKGPAIVEAMCFRFRGHYEGDLDLYRDGQEKARRIAERDPLLLLRERLSGEGLVSAEELDAIEHAERAEMAALLELVRADPLPNPEDAYRHVFASGMPPTAVAAMGESR